MDVRNTAGIFRTSSMRFITPSDFCTLRCSRINTFQTVRAFDLYPLLGRICIPLFFVSKLPVMAPRHRVPE